MRTERQHPADFDEVFGLLASVNGKIAPRALVKQLSAGGRRSPETARGIVRLMVDRGYLSYSYIHGTSFLERSFTCPVKISKNIVLKPPGIFYRRAKGELVITLAPGAAFGCGQHPSTRLALKAMAWCFENYRELLRGGKGRVIDIGTGTGVLAIAAAGFGAHQVLATEVDPCACSEARQNVALNGVSGRVEVVAGSTPPRGKNAVMVTANLRLPTLVNLKTEIEKTTIPGAFLIFSGIRPEEVPQLISSYGDARFAPLHQEVEQNWACVLFQKNGPTHSDG